MTTAKKRKEALSSIVENDSVIEGTVKKITTYGMFVDVGGVDGLVHYSEISYKGPVNPSSLYKEGDKVLVKVISYDNEKTPPISIYQGSYSRSLGRDHKRRPRSWRHYKSNS